MASQQSSNKDLCRSNEECIKELNAQKDSKSLLKKHLTPEVYEKLKDVKTSFGSTLAQNIRSGCMNPASGIGVYAADCESYKAFSELYTPLIFDYHSAKGDKLSHPPMDFGDISRLQNLDPQGEFVLSTRCRVARSIASLPLNPGMTKDDYLKLEDLVKKATKEFTDPELAGEYLSLSEMSEETKKKLIEDHFLYKEGDKYLEAADALNHWPVGRGIYLSNNRNFLIWCGEEDHLRIISMQKGADIGKVIYRLEKALKQFSQHFEFGHSDELGFITFCPSNLGTTIRCSVHIKLPKLSANMEAFEKIASENNLQVRGIHGEHSESEGGIYDLSNKYRHGYTEAQVIDFMYNGVKALIEMERSM